MDASIKQEVILLVISVGAEYAVRKQTHSLEIDYYCLTADDLGKIYLHCFFLKLTMAGICYAEKDWSTILIDSKPPINRKIKQKYL